MSGETVRCFRCQGEGNIATYWEKGNCHNVKCPECGGHGNVPAKSWSGEESAAAWKRVSGK